jgi:hypothetical protein
LVDLKREKREKEQRVHVKIYVNCKDEYVKIAKDWGDQGLK